MLRRALVPVLLASALVGCGSQGLPGGPLPPPDGKSTTCVLSDGSRDLTHGIDDINNLYAAPITVLAVRLLDAHGVRLLAAYVVPVRTGTDGTTVVIGSAGQWPPPDPGTTDWAARRQLPGEVPVGSSANLVLHLQRTRTGSARLSGVEIEYRYRGHRFEVRTANGLLTARTHCPSSGSTRQ